MHIIMNCDFSHIVLIDIDTYQKNQLCDFAGGFILYNKFVFRVPHSQSEKIHYIYIHNICVKSKMYVIN